MNQSVPFIESSKLLVISGLSNSVELLRFRDPLLLPFASLAAVREQGLMVEDRIFVILAIGDDYGLILYF